MNYAANIKKAGNAPGGNKLIAKFPGPDFPDQVTIKGTSDTQSLNGNSGVWISDNKYTSSAITLQLIVGGVVKMEVSYDSNGNLAQPDATITGYSVSANAGLETTSWTSTKEVNLSQYAIDRKLSTDASYMRGIGLIDATGLGKYSLDDALPSTGTFNYQLRAVFIDGSDKVLQNANVNNPAPCVATISPLAGTASGGLVTLTWKSIAESSIMFYLIDRKPTASTTPYEQGVQVMPPLGPNNPYSVDDVPPSSGAWEYQLRVMFNDNTEKVFTPSVTINV